MTFAEKNRANIFAQKDAIGCNNVFLVVYWCFCCCKKGWATFKFWSQKCIAGKLWFSNGFLKIYFQSQLEPFSGEFLVIFYWKCCPQGSQTLKFIRGPHFNKKEISGHRRRKNISPGIDPIKLFFLRFSLS